MGLLFLATIYFLLFIDSIDMENTEILEIANLSLDEPELDAELFISFNNMNDDNIEVN